MQAIPTVLHACYLLLAIACSRKVAAFAPDLTTAASALAEALIVAEESTRGKKVRLACGPLRSAVPGSSLWMCLR